MNNVGKMLWSMFFFSSSVTTHLFIFTFFLYPFYKLGGLQVISSFWDYLRKPSGAKIRILSHTTSASLPAHRPL